MANLKNITDVPEVESLSGSEKVLLNVDGGARQARIDLIKPVEEWDIDAVFIMRLNKESGDMNLEEDIKYIADFQTLKEKIISGVELKRRVSFAFQGSDDLGNLAYGYNRFSVYYYPAWEYAENDESGSECIYFDISGEQRLGILLNPDNTLEYEF